MIFHAYFLESDYLLPASFDPRYLSPCSSSSKLLLSSRTFFSFAREKRKKDSVQNNKPNVLTAAAAAAAAVVPQADRQQADHVDWPTSITPARLRYEANFLSALPRGRNGTFSEGGERGAKIINHRCSSRLSLLNDATLFLGIAV
jgi:hypothetical protein